MYNLFRLQKSKVAHDRCYTSYTDCTQKLSSLLALTLKNYAVIAPDLKNISLIF